MRLRGDLAARRRHERAATPPVEEAPDPSWREVQDILHEELARLPEKYRAPLVLCYLEGMTQCEAARQLQCGDDVLRGRLDRGRERLRQRLRLRGVALATVLLTAAVGQTRVSAALLDATARLASGAAQVPVAALASAVSRSLLAGRLKIAALVVATATIISASGYRLVAVGETVSEDAKPVAEDRQPRTVVFDDPLPPDALVRLGTTRLRHGEEIESLHFTPDGKVLIARSKGGVCTWDTTTGKRIHSFPKESEGGFLPGDALSPDGKQLATPRDRSLHIWDTATAKLLRTIKIDAVFPLVAGPLSMCCFSTDGKMLASQNGDQSNEVTLWDPATGQQIRSWAVGKKRVMFLAFAGEGKTLITASQDNTIRSWDTRTGEMLRENAVLPDLVRALALSPNGNLLAIVGCITKPAGPGFIPAAGAGIVNITLPEPFIRIWDVGAEKEVRRLVQPTSKQNAEENPGFQCLAFAPGGKTLLATAADGTLYECDLAGTKELRRVWRGSGQISAVTVSPDGKTAAVATIGAIHLIDLASGKDVFPITGHPQHVYKTAITPDGRTIVTASGPDLYLWDAASGRLRKRLQGHNDYINGLVLIDGGRKAVTSAYQEGNLRVWDLVAEKEACRIESPDKMNILQAVSPDGKTIAVGGSNSLTVLFDARTGKEIQRLEGHGKFNDYGAAFTPDGRMLVVWYCDDNMVYLWDLATGRKVREYAFVDGDPPLPNPPAGGRPVYFAAVSPDGRLIAFGSQSRFFEVRDLATGEVLYRQTKLPDGVCPVTFSPDSRTLAWSGWWNDPTVHVVEIATGKDRRRFAGHTGRVLSLSFSADGTKLVSGSGDTTALVWDLTAKRAAPADWAKPLSTKELEAAWEALASDDSARAFDTIRRLSAAPQEPIAFFREHLKPVGAVDEKQLTRLIGNLDSDEFTVREKATQELEALGEAAVDACRKALQGNPSAEAHRRLERLLSKQLREKGLPSPERLRTLRALEILERAGTTEARQLLAALAGGAPGAWLTREAKAALGRLSKE
jgi:WD40 repeat protein